MPNLLEHYIEVIHSVQPYERDWTAQFGKFVEVDLTNNCYGRSQRTTQVWNINDWERIKAQGYYMA
jgi:hypothetical protein